MSELKGKRFVEPNDIETQVFDWGVIKWFSEPRVTNAEKFSMGIVILEPGKGHILLCLRSKPVLTITQASKRFCILSLEKGSN